MSALRAFLRGLIDDAGLFPPAALDMAQALRVDAAARAGADAWMVGRFILPAPRLGELLMGLNAPAAPLGLSVIVDPVGASGKLDDALGTIGAGAHAARIESVEVRPPAAADGDLRGAVLRLVADLDASALGPGTAVYVELDLAGDWRARVATVAGALADARTRSKHDVCAKLRCGGVTADAVPAPAQVAFTIGTLRALGVPFKATAGLHHPVRHHNAAAGFVMHGFLNVIGAAVLDHALDLDDRTRADVVAEEDPAAFALGDDAFAWRDLRVPERDVAEARRSFVRSYGSCSLSEPVEDLVALGILERAPA